MAKGMLQRKCACGHHNTGGSECSACRKKREDTLQRAPLRGPVAGSAPPAVYEVLRSPGRMLDADTRALMEPRFGYDFSNVRVHTDARATESAAAVNARAYTVGHNIVFGTGQYAPEQPAGQHLLAHELTHVVQQQQVALPAPVAALKISAPGDAAEMEAGRAADMAVSGERATVPVWQAPSSTALMRNGTELGTAKTTSPIAKLSPRTEMLSQLTDETTLFNNAQVIIDWALKKEGNTSGSTAAGSTTTGTTPTGSAAPFSFSAGELIKDKALVKKMKPVPKKEEDLTAILDFLVAYSIIEKTAATGAAGSTPTFALKKDLKTNQPDLSVFTKDRQSITKFQKQFKKRQKRPSPLDPVVETSVLPPEMAAGSAKERKTEKVAAATLEKVDEELATLRAGGANDEETQKKLEKLEAKKEKAEKANIRAQGHHTFAEDVTNLLLRLRKINTSWKAGTYPGHSWGEFSVDIFLSTSLVEMKDAGKYSGKFWNRKVVTQFFDDLNTVAEEKDATAGKFAWRAIYNDIPLAAKINKKYGAGRVIQKENHGPVGHKLHIHLDLRPIQLRLDSKSGFEKKDGRIKLLP